MEQSSKEMPLWEVCMCGLYNFHHFFFSLFALLFFKSKNKEMQKQISLRRSESM